MILLIIITSRYLELIHLLTSLYTLINISPILPHPAAGGRVISTFYSLSPSLAF